MKLGTAILPAVLVAALSTGFAQAVDVKALWEKNCTQCHGPDGKGVTKMGRKLNIRDLTDPKVQANVTDEQMTKNIKEGVKDETGKVRMKPAENVNDNEIKALVNYVRKLKAQ
jgi:cytochrome c551/c552